MLDITGQRSATLRLGRSCPITLGDTEFTLRVLTIAANERWNAQLDGRTAALIDGLTRDGADVTDILSALNGQTDEMIDLLRSYDQEGDGVLPTADEIKEIAYADQLLTAVREVWLAANPLAAIALRSLAIVTSASSQPTSSPPPPGTSPRKRSGRH